MNPTDPLADVGQELDGEQGLVIDDVLHPDDCLACGHPRFFHSDDGGNCLASPGNANSFAPRHWKRCWCHSFAATPTEASAEILAHGDSAALRRGTDEALQRQDSESAQRLVTRYIQKSPEGERDQLWVDDATRQIAEFGTNHTATTAPQNEFRRTNNTWKIVFNGEECHLPSMVGLEYIAALLRQPLRRVSVMELQSIAGSSLRDAMAIADTRKLTMREASGDEDTEEKDRRLVSQLDFSRQPTIDLETLSAIKRELKRAEDNATYAYTIGDQAKGDECEQKYKTLNAYLKKNLNNRGRVRCVVAEREKGRPGVKKGLDRAIQAIERAGAANTARYLQQRISTGSDCMYLDESTVWLL